MPISFTKTRLPFGWLGNMAAFPIQYEGKEWRTTEALFQALRFNDPTIREEIRRERSPMGAKIVAKKYPDKMMVAPVSEQDFKNMEIVLRLKLEQHPNLKEELLKTGNEDIIEDVTQRLGGRNLIWGMSSHTGEWIGKNVLGNIWMKLRKELTTDIPEVKLPTIKELDELETWIAANEGQVQFVNMKPSEVNRLIAAAKLSIK